MRIQRLLLTATASMLSAAALAQRLVIEPATFEDLDLTPASFWRGDTTDPEYTNGSFASGYFEFNNLFLADWDTWAFFAYANLTDTTYESPADQYKCAAGGGHHSPTYALGYVATFMGVNHVWIYGNDGGDVLDGMWVTNSAWVHHSVTQGNTEERFVTGDKLTLRICGYDEQEHATGVVEFALADYTSPDEADHYCLDTWQWVPLSALGSVAELRFDMVTTRRNIYGDVTPTYFCLDDVNTPREVTRLEEVAIAPGGRMDLTPLFTLDASQGKITYSIEGDGLALADDATAEVTALDGDRFTAIIGATQRGCSSYVELPVHVDKTEGVDAPVVSPMEISRAGDILLINTTTEDYALTVYTLSGQVLVCDTNMHGSAQLALHTAEPVTVTVTGRHGHITARKLR